MSCAPLLAIALMLTHATAAAGEASVAPETVSVHNGAVTLHALLWHPSGPAPFPTVLFTHGSGPTMEPDKPATLGPLFAKHGYVFLFLYRRGAGLSADQGTSPADLMDQEAASHGPEARNELQLRLLETDQLSDVLAGLAFLRGRSDVDARRLVVAGHSFGGVLALLAAERDRRVAAVVDFAGGARSWSDSPALRARLLAVVDRITAPVFFIHAANDYSVAPAKVLGAEMARLGKPYRVMIYPVVGKTAAEGHDLVYLGVATWEPDVFAFLDESMRAESSEEGT
jgi:dienelactone hydrolase